MAVASQLASFFTKIGFQIDEQSIRQFEATIEGLKKKIKENTSERVAGTRRQMSEEQKLINQQKANERRRINQENQLQRIQERGRQKLMLEELKHKNMLARQEARASMRGQRKGGLFGGLGMLRGLAGPLVGGFGLAEVGRGVFNAGQTMAALRSSLAFLTGSEKEATNEIGFLNKEVDRLSLNFSDAAKNYSSLLASTKENIGIENTKNLFSAISELGVVLNLTEDAQERAIRAFGQMASKGKIMSEELEFRLAA